MFRFFFLECFTSATLGVENFGGKIAMKIVGVGEKLELGRRSGGREKRFGKALSFMGEDFLKDDDTKIKGY